MLNDGVGKNFPNGGASRSGPRRDATRGAVHVLVVDAVLGSRFALVQAASQPGFVVDAAGSIAEAEAQLAATSYSIVVVDEDLAGASGLAFLSRLREQHPRVARVLVSGEDGFHFKRHAIRSAGLSVVITKPWRGESLRQTLRSLVAEGPDFTGWDRVFPGASANPSVSANTPVGASEVAGHRRHHELLLRGLLAGLNSCESEEEIFELLHFELAPAFSIDRWIWAHRDAETVAALAGDWPLQSGIAIEALEPEAQAFLEQARRCRRVARVDGDAQTAVDRREACLGWTLRLAEDASVTGLVWVDRARVALLSALLRELLGGLQLAFQRIRGAATRAIAARDLARRVSLELRTPMGALTHAIDRLRGEAERAGLSSEWVDRVSSESERVARAVAHLEGEMLAPPSANRGEDDRSAPRSEPSSPVV